jgi:hypothetical protein
LLHHVTRRVIFCFCDVAVGFFDLDGEIVFVVAIGCFVGVAVGDRFGVAVGVVLSP